MKKLILIFILMLAMPILAEASFTKIQYSGYYCYVTTYYSGYVVTNIYLWQNFVGWVFVDSSVN